MSLLNKLYYHTWNIGFIECSIEEILLSNSKQVNVHWLKHNYKDRFFADPFILSIDNNEIKVLVEDFPYYDKRGIISLLIIDRKSYKLKEKREILKQPFHMSYPFIMRKSDGTIWVAPEASQSGNLYRYNYNIESNALEDKEVLLQEPVLDSTIIEYEGKFWLFCTKRGENSNKQLFIYYADKPEGPWNAHLKNPVVSNLSMSRPAGYMKILDGIIYRVSQKCDVSYGEAINVSRIDKLSEKEFKETFIKELRAQKDMYSGGFHTINGLDNICVVDGNNHYDFAPFRRLWYEFRNKIKITSL